MAETKICAKCGKELPAEQFSKNSKAADGLYSYCKSCHSAYYAQYKKERGLFNEELVSTRELTEEELQEVEHLANESGRALILELRRRGYCGELKQITERRVVV